MADAIEAKAPQYLSFTVAGTDYGVPILAVKEILQHEEPTRVPGTPASIRGIINVRGRVVPVIDLAVRLGRPETVASRTTCVLVVEASASDERLTVGVLVDAVKEVLELPAGATQAPPSFGTDVRVEYLAAMGRVGSGFVLLLDVDRLVAGADEGDRARLAACESRGAPPHEPASS